MKTYACDIKDTGCSYYDVLTGRCTIMENCKQKRLEDD